ncbi:MAG: hypothetical protein UX65_C0004G0055 [Parcubacteria group bacterium GW2011_GWB1_46_8]|nr:MAG: hypothetical protein UX14_C0002G0023 [Parcubacteria group bacterium GW2011_GWF1_45_5]KKU11257.1 MAG: hypothetical protein UX15_C0012G0014 [Parcubacteria group bacterium GW2011_GWA1_45_7]KKU46409.1 MAG: hypothetical protein UX65_C0004G0055 [Parcubacteria group bacterium GW2011_GWB1_46_8]KKU47512.1 MAG: hypothetical protein UX66_C0011G0006 [Parcubacteria group bacterium GW2011_GWF2_46_8]
MPEYVRYFYFILCHENSENCVKGGELSLGWVFFIKIACQAYPDTFFVHITRLGMGAGGRFVPPPPCFTVVFDKVVIGDVAHALVEVEFFDFFKSSGIPIGSTLMDNNIADVFLNKLHVFSIAVTDRFDKVLYRAYNGNVHERTVDRLLNDSK